MSTDHERHALFCHRSATTLFLSLFPKLLLKALFNLVLYLTSTKNFHSACPAAVFCNESYVQMNCVVTCNIGGEKVKQYPMDHTALICHIISENNGFCTNIMFTIIEILDVQLFWGSILKHPSFLYFSIMSHPINYFEMLKSKGDGGAWQVTFSCLQEEVMGVMFKMSSLCHGHMHLDNRQMWYQTSKDQLSLLSFATVLDSNTNKHFLMNLNCQFKDYMYCIQGYTDHSTPIMP